MDPQSPSSRRSAGKDEPEVEDVIRDVGSMPSKWPALPWAWPLTAYRCELIRSRPSDQKRIVTRRRLLVPTDCTIL